MLPPKPLTHRLGQAVDMALYEHVWFEYSPRDPAAELLMTNHWRLKDSPSCGETPSFHEGLYDTRCTKPQNHQVLRW